MTWQAWVWGREKTDRKQQGEDSIYLDDLETFSCIFRLMHIHYIKVALTKCR